MQNTIKMRRPTVAVNQMRRRETETDKLRRRHRPVQIAPGGAGTWGGRIHEWPGRDTTRFT